MVAALFSVPDERVADFAEYDECYAIGFFIYRARPSGSPADPDIFGAQQYAPLVDIDVAVAAAREPRAMPQASASGEQHRDDAPITPYSVLMFSREGVLMSCRYARKRVGLAARDLRNC